MSNFNSQQDKVQLEEIEICDKEMKSNPKISNDIGTENKQSDEKLEIAQKIVEKKDSRQFEMNDSTDEDLQVVDKFKVPDNLKKTFIFTMILAGVGLILIILGCIHEVASADPGKGITFWVLGSIVMIPGGYYSYQFYKAKKAKSEDEREEILDQIPEL